MGAETVTRKAKDLLNRKRVDVGRRRRFAERVSVDDRSRGASTMILVIGGHKPQLWPYTLPRIADAAPEGVDVCLVTPGVDSAELRSLAASLDWTYMSTEGGHV